MTRRKLTHGDGGDQRSRLKCFLVWHVFMKTSLAIHQNARASSAIATVTRQERGRLDLRNTARGASSPAKPALHIPELKHHQSVSIPSMFIKTRELFGVERSLATKSWRETDCMVGSRFTTTSARNPRIQEVVKMALQTTYPLSITRAATSSVNEKFN